MNRSDLQFEILVYLDYKDFLSISQVNRFLRSACSNPRLWQREVLRLFSSDSVRATSNPEISMNWREECKRGHMLQGEWKSCCWGILSTSESSLLFSELLQSLTDPEPVLPALRREINTFPTIVQDMLGNPDDLFEEDFDLQEYTADLRQALFSNIESLHFQYEARRFGTQNPLEIMDCIHKTVAFFCSVNARLVADVTSPEEFIGEYLNKWELFCNSIVFINKLFLPVSEIIAEITGKSYPVACFLIEIWTAEVFAPLKSRLFESYLELVNRERSCMLEEGYFPNSELLYGFTQAVCDLSFTSESIYFKNHTQVKLSGAILELMSFFVEESKFHYNTIHLPVENMITYLEKDQSLIECILLKSASTALQLFKFNLLKPLIFQKIVQMLYSFEPSQESYTCPMNSPIYTDLVNSGEDPLKVASFMADPAASTLRHYFNEISLYQRPMIDDACIEHVARGLSLPFSALGLDVLIK